jgi:hypothetical protein
MLALSYPAMADDVPQVDDVPQAVKDACQGDYDKYCSKHGDDRQAVRDCMAHAFENLSEPCVTAILDSPLADQQAPPQEAAAAPSEESTQPIPVGQETAAPKEKRIARANHSTRMATAKHPPRNAYAKPAVRLAKTKPSTKQIATGKRATRVVHAQYQARPRERYARHAGKPRRSVAGYIRRGTGIANYYVAKYTRFALAKAFR